LKNYLEEEQKQFINEYLSFRHTNGYLESDDTKYVNPLRTFLKKVHGINIKKIYEWAYSLKNNPNKKLKKNPNLCEFLYSKGIKRPKTEIKVQINKQIYPRLRNVCISTLKTWFMPPKLSRSRFTHCVSCLNRFCLFLTRKKIKEFVRVKPKHISKFVTELKGRRYPHNSQLIYLKPRTINMYVSIIKRFFDALFMEDMIQYNPVNRRHFQKTGTDLPRDLSYDEAKKLLAALPDDWLRPIVYLGLKAGLRNEEALSVEVEKIDWGKGTIQIKGKKGKDRIIYMTKKLKDEIKRWMHRRKKMPKSKYLVHHQGKRYSNHRIVVRILELRKKLKFYFSFYSLRHTFAIRYIENKGSIEALQKLLGHKHISTTKLYLRRFPTYLLIQEWLKASSNAEQKKVKKHEITESYTLSEYIAKHKK